MPQHLRGNNLCPLCKGSVPLMSNSPGSLGSLFRHRPVWEVPQDIQLVSSPPRSAQNAKQKISGAEQQTCLALRERPRRIWHGPCTLACRLYEAGETQRWGLVTRQQRGLISSHRGTDRCDETHDPAFALCATADGTFRICFIWHITSAANTPVNRIPWPSLPVNHGIMEAGVSGGSRQSAVYVQNYSCTGSSDAPSMRYLQRDA